MKGESVLHHSFGPCLKFFEHRRSFQVGQIQPTGRRTVPYSRFTRSSISLEARGVSSSERSKARPVHPVSSKAQRWNFFFTVTVFCYAFMASFLGLLLQFPSGRLRDTIRVMFGTKVKSRK